MSKNSKNRNIDIILMSDNGLETVGGEQESTKIIIDGVKDKFTLGVIQPGVVKNRESNVKYFNMTEKTRIKHLIKNPFGFISYIYKTRKIINREKPKIIHTQAQVSFFIIGLLRRFNLISRSIKLIHTERGLYIKYSLLFKKIFVFFMRELDTLVTTTKLNMKHWKKALQDKRYPVKFNIIENTAGKIFETYDPAKEKKDDGKLVLGFAGRYANWKNWPLAVEISEKLKYKLGNDLVVKMAVGCLDELSLRATKEMFNFMSNLLDENFEGRINMTLEEMDQFYYDLDVFILTSNSNSESFGRTLVEAMSRKTVVLTTDSGGPEEIVRDNTSICTTVEEFTKKIEGFYSDPILMEKEKELNLKEVRNRYTLQNNIKKHIKLYNDLVQ